MECLRKCVACGKIRNRRDMIKITKEHRSGNVIVAPDSRIFGRSVYLCYNQSCIQTVLKKGIEKPLKVKMSREGLKGLLDGQFKSQ